MPRTLAKNSSKKPRPLKSCATSNANTAAGRRRLDLQKGPARRRGGVHGRVDRSESDAALVEFVDEGDELAGAAPEPVEVEVEDDEDIAAAQVVEAGGEARAIGRGAGGVILEHALAAGGVQGVELPVEDRRPSAVETRA